MKRIFSGKIMCLVWMALGLFSVPELKAHQVCWWGNGMGFLTNNPLTIYTQFPTAEVTVAPTYNEPCTVTVYLYTNNSTLISAQVLAPNPANKVKIVVSVLRAPSNHVELVYLRGYWSATGYPLFNGCTSTGTNDFTVPISVSDQLPSFGISFASQTKTINLDTKYYAALAESSCITGPFEIKALGQQYSLSAHSDGKFYERIDELGGLVNGTITDPTGSPISGVQFTYPYGGLYAGSDSGGNYYLPTLAAGYHDIIITHPNGAILPVGFMSYDDSVINFKVAMASPAVVTNPCNYTPWCAIGYGMQDGAPTPMFYAGGANVPSNKLVQVMVAPPIGVAYSIHAGMNRIQKTATNPASGTWTISATACGQSQSASITVP
jgi:hypothetical protein